MAARSCARCDVPIEWQGNRHRPFCSERCRMADLEGWLGGRYAIPGDPLSPEAVAGEGDEAVSGGSAVPPRKARR